MSGITPNPGLVHQILRYGPIKYAYIAFEAIKLAATVPLSFLYFLPRSNRLRPSWGLSDSVKYYALRNITAARRRLGTLSRYSDYWSIREESNTHGVWVDPVAFEDLAPDIQRLARAADVTPSRITGYWTYQDELETVKRVAGPPKNGEKVLYAMHGGSYISLSAHSNDVCASIGKGLLRRVDSGPHVQRVFSIEYRFATSDPFPSQLIDALSGYEYLVNEVGFSPSNIILLGDSAGGNLALALTRYFVENAPEKVPGGMILLSPWSDLSAKAQDTDSMHFTSDYIYRQYPNASQFLTAPFGLGLADNSRWISPGLEDGTWNFAGFPKTLILGGGAEIFRDQIRGLKRKMEKDLGSDNVQYLEIADAVHDWIVLPLFEAETQQGLEVVAKWLRDL